MINEILTITALITTIFTIFTILAALYGKYIFDRITGDAFDLSFIGYVRSITAMLVMFFIFIFLHNRISFNISLHGVGLMGTITSINKSRGAEKTMAFVRLVMEGQ